MGGEVDVPRNQIEEEVVVIPKVPIDFDEKRKIHIHGVLEKFEEENSQKNKAGLIREALLDCFQEDWSIITYSKCE
jgi:hypothetical protein